MKNRFLQEHRTFLKQGDALAADSLVSSGRVVRSANDAGPGQIFFRRSSPKEKRHSMRFLAFVARLQTLCPCHEMMHHQEAKTKYQCQNYVKTDSL